MSETNRDSEKQRIFTHGVRVSGWKVFLYLTIDFFPETLCYRNRSTHLVFIPRSDPLPGVLWK